MDEKNTNRRRFRDPTEIAATVAMMHSDENGIPLNEAIARLMKSETFRNLMSEPDDLDKDPHEILAAFHTEKPDPYEIFTLFDYTDLKINVTLGFAKRYEMSVSDTVDLFQSNEIYELIDRGGWTFMTQMYGYTVNYIARELNIPVKDEPFVG